MGHTTNTNGRFWRLGLTTLAVLTFLGAGCHFDHGDRDDEPGTDTGWTLADTGPDGVDDDVDDDKPHPTKFRLVNDSNHPIRVQQRSSCMTTGLEWVSLRDGQKRMDVSNFCSTCSCEDIESGNGCAICAAACAQVNVVQLQPGESKTWEWHGRQFVQDRVNGQSCTRSAIPKRKSYEARFCWSDKSSPTGPVRKPKNMECENVSFEYGKDSLVEYEVDTQVTKPQPYETTFELTNNKQYPVTITEPSHCRTNAGQWIGLEQNGEEKKMSTWCGDCRCDSVANNGGCAVCDAACLGPRQRTVQPGETITHKWQGITYPEATRNGQTCREKKVPSRGETFDAVFCWREAHAADGAPQPPAECKRVEFSYGDETVVTHELEKDEDRQPVTTTFKLVNISKEPIRVQKWGQCRPAAWLSFDNKTIKAGGSPCRYCSCEQVKQHGSCPVCAAAGACRAPTVEKLATNDAVEWSWDGHIYEKDSFDEKTCYRKVVPKQKRPFKVTFCWKSGDGSSGDNVTLKNQRCVTRSFRYGADQTIVEHVR